MTMEISTTNQEAVNALSCKIQGDTSSTHRLSRRNLPRKSVNILLEWLRDHCEYPYPDESDKADLKKRTGLTYTQVNNWFINARRRVLMKIARRKHMLLTVSNKMGGKKYKSIPVPSKKTVAVDTTPLPLNIVAAVLLHFAAAAPSLTLVTKFDNGLHLTGTAEDNNSEHKPANQVLSPPAKAIKESPAPAEHQASVEQDKLTKLEILAMVASACKLKMDREEAKKKAALSSNITT